MTYKFSAKSIRERKPRPPFSRHTEGRGRRIDGSVLVGPGAMEIAWRMAEKSAFTGLTAVLPDGEDPEGFDWRGFAHREVRIIDYTEGREPQPHALAVELVRAGARRVVSIPVVTDRGITTYAPNERQEAA